MRELHPAKKGRKQLPETELSLSERVYIYNDLNMGPGAIVFLSSKGGEFSFESERSKRISPKK
jgi:hypothetical protein